jgi:hypothetical protein
MSSDAELVELIGREADERLLDPGDAQALPASIPPPPAASGESPARRRLVAGGAALTGVTLLGGIALILLALVQLVREGFGAGWMIAAVLGVLLVATHWGWVHVAELTATRLDSRHAAPGLSARRRWLEAIEPYPRYEITTRVLEDGAIEIVRSAHRPVPSGEHAFSFVCEVERRERHDPDEPAAAVAERAELLRRATAAETERERARYELAAQAYRAALLAGEDAQQRQLARRAASAALSEAINENLRSPPLVE